jgi:ABC-type Fe3+-hydroxamate transport system substrate-binding protein
MSDSFDLSKSNIPESDGREQPGLPETAPGIVEPQTYVYGADKPVDYVPRRVVSLVPSLTESLCDLNLADRLIGVTDYCIRPASIVQRLPKVGGTKNPDIARIIALRPDLVLMNREENREEDSLALQAAGIPIWATHPDTIREALDLLWAIMDLFEEGSASARVRLIEIKYEWTLGVTMDKPARRVFVPIWRDPWMTINKHTYIHDVLRVCGGENVFADRERHFPLAADLGLTSALPADDPRVADRDLRYPRVSLEEIVAAQPEIVLLPDEPYTFTDLDAADFGALDIPAARTKSIYVVDGSLLSWHGTRVSYALRELPGIFVEDLATN